MIRLGLVNTWALRIALSFSAVAILSTLISALAVLFVIELAPSVDNTALHRSLIDRMIRAWALEETVDADRYAEFAPLAGYTLIVDRFGVVRDVNGDNRCSVGDLLQWCEAGLMGLQAGEAIMDRDGKPWQFIVVDLISGGQVISYRAPQPGLILPLREDIVVDDWLPWLLLVLGLTAVVALPLALMLTALYILPLARRVQSLVAMSRAFADGNLQARVHDPHADDIGVLAREFDDMAATLEQNINGLQDIARRNSELMYLTEKNAIQAERLRLARDLHDSVAQRLFSLSVNAATLPGMIRSDPKRGQDHALMIASLAEDTLSDLRSVLVDLRPSPVIDTGFFEAMYDLCEDWRRAHDIPISCSLMHMNEPLPPNVEDLLYRVTQEALSNIAKHAQASTVQVALVLLRGAVALRIVDDGIGFDVSRSGQHGHFGLKTMSERAQSARGRLMLESRPGATSLSLIIDTVEREPATA